MLLIEGESDFDMKREHCGLFVKGPQRVEEDLEEVGWSRSWVIPRVLGPPCLGGEGCQSWGRAGLKRLPPRNAR